MLLQTAIVSPELVKSVQVVTGMKFTLSPQAAFMFVSVLPVPLALNNTPTPPCEIEPEVIFAAVSEASSSSSNIYGVAPKLIVDPVLLYNSAHSQAVSLEAGSYIISLIIKPARAPPPGTVPGLPR